MTVGDREAGHTSPYAGRSVVWHDGRSHGAQTHWIGELKVLEAKLFRAGVSRSALSLLHLAAGASQPIQWPRVPCGSYAGRVLAFLPVPSGLFHTGHAPGDRPSRRAGYGRKKPARGVSRSAGSSFVTVGKSRLASMPPLGGVCTAKRLIVFHIPTSLGSASKINYLAIRPASCPTYVQ